MSTTTPFKAFDYLRDDEDLRLYVAEHVRLARRMRRWQMYALVVLGLCGGLGGFFLWANAEWLSPFVGILLGVALPFAGAMVTGAK